MPALYVYYTINNEWKLDEWHHFSSSLRLPKLKEPSNCFYILFSVPIEYKPAATAVLVGQQQFHLLYSSQY